MLIRQRIFWFWLSTSTTHLLLFFYSHIEYTKCTERKRKREKRHHLNLHKNHIKIHHKTLPWHYFIQHQYHCRHQPSSSSSASPPCRISLVLFLLSLSYTNDQKHKFKIIDFCLLFLFLTSNFSFFPFCVYFSKVWFLLHTWR